MSPAARRDYYNCVKYEWMAPAVDSSGKENEMRFVRRSYETEARRDVAKRGEEEATRGASVMELVIQQLGLRNELELATYICEEIRNSAEGKSWR